MRPAASAARSVERGKRIGTHCCRSNETESGVSVMGRLQRRILFGVALVVLVCFVLLGANLRTEIACRAIKVGSTRTEVRTVTCGLNESRVSVANIPLEWRHGISPGDSSRIFRYRLLWNDIYVVYDKQWRAAEVIPEYE